MPGASNVDFEAGQTIPNQVTAAIGSDGKVCVHSPTTVHVVVGLWGWYGPEATDLVHVIDPVRALDTVTEPAGVGHVSVFPCGGPQPFVSSVNYEGGQTIPNQATIGVGTGGTICIFTTATTHVLIDLQAYADNPTAMS